MQPTLIADYACVCGEGPLWHPDEQRLYWVDIPTGRLFRYDPATGHHECCYVAGCIGGFTIQADGGLLLFGAEGRIWTWHDGVTRTIIEALHGEVGNRFNDVIADPEGRVFCGTMRTDRHPGRLYRLDVDGRIHLLLDDVLCSNGLGFTPDLRRLYYTDSMRHQITLFDYDRATGRISNRQPWVTLPPDEGVPDGMTVDADGYVWSAKWDGGCVVRLAPDGREERRITFPAQKVSSVVFGGPDNTDLWVTTAGGDQKPTDGAGAGALFHLNLGIRGGTEFRSRVGLA